MTAVDLLDDAFAEVGGCHVGRAAVAQLIEEPSFEAEALTAVVAAVEVETDLLELPRRELHVEERVETRDAVVAVHFAHPFRGDGRSAAIPRSCARSKSRFWRNFRPRWSRDITVPMGMPSISAISL